ncbi:MAG: hypothetical protein ACFFE8_17020, partial [Candidatus Heimdallarchaeota archaeon]
MKEQRVISGQTKEEPNSGKEKLGYILGGPVRIKIYSEKILLSCLLILLISQITPITGNQSEWSSNIKADSSYSWYALKSELRNLKTDEQYRDKYLIGGINVPG